MDYHHALKLFTVNDDLQVSGVHHVLSVLDRTPLAGVLATTGPTIRERGYTDAQFTVDALPRDTGLTIGFSALALPTLEAAAAVLQAANDNGRGGEDFSVIADG